MIRLKEYQDYYEGFLKGMEDIYTLVWKKDPKAFTIPSMGNWDYDVLTSMYSVGYYKGFCYYQKILLSKDENYICFYEILEKNILDSYKESYIYQRHL